MWDGEVYKDNVGLGGGPTVATLKFDSITDDTGFFRGGYDGIMGFGPDTALLPGTTSYITGAIAGGLNSRFAFQLCPGHRLACGSAASIRRRPPRAPVYSNLDAGVPFNIYYAVQVSGAQLGSADLGIAAADFGPTIIDTGTSISFVPSAVLTKLENGIKDSAGYKAVFGTQSLTSQDGVQTTMSSSQIDSMLPPLALVFPGSSTPVSIPASRSYLSYEGSMGGQNYYVFAFQDSSQLFGQGGNASLFGDSLLAGMVAVFDIGNSQVGFSPQAGCHAADVDRRERPVIHHTPGTPWWKDDPRVHLPPNLPIKLDVGATGSRYSGAGRRRRDALVEHEVRLVFLRPGLVAVDAALREQRRWVHRARARRRLPPDQEHYRPRGRHPEADLRIVHREAADVAAHEAQHQHHEHDLVLGHADLGHRQPRRHQVAGDHERDRHVTPHRDRRDERVAEQLRAAERLVGRSYLRNTRIQIASRPPISVVGNPKKIFVGTSSSARML